MNSLIKWGIIVVVVVMFFALVTAGPHGFILVGGSYLWTGWIHGWHFIYNGLHK